MNNARTRSLSPSSADVTALQHRLKRRLFKHRSANNNNQKYLEQSVSNQVEAAESATDSGWCVGEPSAGSAMSSLVNSSNVFADEVMEWIPLEVLSHIFSFLHVKDIYAVSLVSKKFFKATQDCLLWKQLCLTNLGVSAKWDSLTWKDYYKMVSCITWDQENCMPNEFKFSDGDTTLTKVTSYGVATGRAKYCFTPDEGKRYVLDIRVNYRRPNFFYGIGFIDKDIGFNFSRASYPKVNHLSDPVAAEAQERRYESQWFYWSDGNCWDILGSHPVSSKTRTFVAKKGIERPQGTTDSSAGNPPSLAFYSGDTIGIVLDYSSKSPLLTFFLNGQKAHQFAIPRPLNLYLAVYFYNASDSVSIMHCAPDKYDALL